MNIFDVDALKFWNILATVVSGSVALYNLQYFRTHANGKKWVRLFSFGVLIVVFILRLSLELGLLTNESAQLWLRSWSNLVYMLPFMDAYVDWQLRKGKMDAKSN